MARFGRKARVTEDVRIEYPSRGATYCNPEYGVYRYSEYPRSSVLAGQERREFLGSYDTLEEARAAHPNSDPHVHTESGYRAPHLAHLPGEDDADPHGDDIDWDAQDRRAYREERNERHW
jgi:hypothetical protein